MIDNIELTTERYEFDYTKNKYELKDYKVIYINETFYDNATCKDTVNFFKRLGGKEYYKKAHTKFGRKIIESISKSPRGELKTIRYYDFNNAVEV